VCYPQIIFAVSVAFLNVLQVMSRIELFVIDSRSHYFMGWGGGGSNPSDGKWEFNYFTVF
jgi:hypothetical protein